MPNLSELNPDIQEILKKPSITSNEFALISGYHPVTVRRKLAAGEIPSVRFGEHGAHRIPHAVVLRLLGVG